MLDRFWYSQFPEWARPDHPVMRSIVRPAHGISRRRRWLRWALIMILVGAAIAMTISLRPEMTLRDALYGPLVILQVVAVILALILTANTVATEEQRGTWDTLKLTLVGVPLTLRARWIAVFHQLRWLLIAIILGRVVFVGLLLTDLTEFQGRALDLYISGIDPEVSLDAAVVLMVAFMTAFIMQPVVAVAMSAALGIVLAVTVRSRALVFVLMLVLIGLYLALVGGGILLGENIVINRAQTLIPAEIDPTIGWGVLALMSLGGDMAIRLTELQLQGQIWADLENGVYWSAGYLALVLLAAMVANQLVVIASQRATRPSRT